MQLPTRFKVDTREWVSLVELRLLVSVRGLQKDVAAEAGMLTRVSKTLVITNFPSSDASTRVNLGEVWLAPETPQLWEVDGGILKPFWPATLIESVSSWFTEGDLASKTVIEDTPLSTSGLHMHVYTHANTYSMMVHEVTHDSADDPRALSSDFRMDHKAVILAHLDWR